MFVASGNINSSDKRFKLTICKVINSSCGKRFGYNRANMKILFQKNQWEEKCVRGILVNACVIHKGYQHFRPSIHHCQHRMMLQRDTITLWQQDISQSTSSRLRVTQYTEWTFHYAFHKMIDVYKRTHWPALFTTWKIRPLSMTY